MSPKQRKAQLILHGKTMSAIAADLEVTPSHVAAVVRGQRRARRVERAVAEALGMPVNEVFEPVPQTHAA